MTAPTVAHLLFAAVVALAIAFHRHRAAQVGVVAWLVLAALGDPDGRIPYAAMRFGPWLLLFAAVVPEARMLSRRHALFAVALAGCVAVAVGAPDGLYARLAWLAALPLPGWTAPPPVVLVFVAAFACGVRWFVRGQPVEFALSLALLLLGYGLLDGARHGGWFVGAAAVLLAGIVWASYRMAFVDTLTGLPNRRALDETLARLSGHYTLAMIDIDHFKSFNDTWGHDAGDRVLRSVARGLRRHAGGRAFRYGGEEFCVVYAGSDPGKAATFLEQARERIGAARILIPARKRAGAGNADLRREPKAVSVTVSAGCAARDGERRGAGAVLKAADEALYSAKRRGRNRVVRG